MLIRPATEAELDRIGELTVGVYVGDGLVPKDAAYVRDLENAAGRFAEAELIVAEVDGELAGTVTYAPAGSSYAEICDEGEAAFRMLAVATAFRGRGIGEALVKECIGRALGDGAAMLRLSTQDESHAAHRIYERLGFVPTPERDWYPVPDKVLRTFELRLWSRCAHCGEQDREGHLATHGAAAALEPPRYCTICARRMVVQVTPTGWTAVCSAHGLRSG